MTETFDLVVEVLNPLTGCISATVAFRSDLPVLEGAVGHELSSLIEGGAYSLNSAEIAAVASVFELPALTNIAIANLRMRHDIDDWPYQCHTYRELDMMLAGTKPLAAFHDPADAEWFMNIRRHFAPHVASGAILEDIEQNRIIAPDGREYLMVKALYALPGEEWRFEAWRQMWADAAQTGWNESLERRQGELLGYEPWQRDWFMARYAADQDDKNAAAYGCL